MNLFRISTVTAATAALMTCFTLTAAQAQTGIFSPATFSVTTTGDVSATGGVGSTFLYNGSSPATLTLTSTGGSITEAANVITDALTGVDVTITAGANVTTVTGATGDMTINGDLVSFDAATLGTTTSPYGPVTDLSFSFTAAPTPAITGTTVVTGPPPVIINGTFTSTFGGTDGVVNTSYVPEPGVVSLLAGLAVAGTGFRLRRRRVG
jgi:hypothetical protein